MQRLSCPVDVQLELSEGCNFRCRHCYNYWRYSSDCKKNELSKSQFLRVVGVLNDCGVSAITLTGGEPLLRQDVVFAVLKEAKRLGMEVGLNSNATLITADIARRLKCEGLDHALCSLLGKEETHDFITCSKNGFSRAKAGIENLVMAGIPVAVNMVVSQLNKGEVTHVGELVGAMGAKTFCATPMVPSHASNRSLALSGDECKQALRDLMWAGKTLGLNFDTLEPVARCLFSGAEEDEFLYFFGNRICSAAVTSCAISSLGMVRPCIHADVSFGNILQENFSSIWTKMSPWSEESILPQECLDCAATAICEGGCRMSSKMVSGRYNGKDMYMSEPIIDKARVVKLPIRERKETAPSADERLLMNSSARLRAENFGGIAYVGNKIEFLSASGFELVRLMVRRKEFTPIDIAKEAGFAVDVVVLVAAKLLRSKILTKGR